MTSSDDLNRWLAARRAAASHVCTCSHARDQHFERVGGCNRCSCAAFRRREEKVA